MLLALFGPTRIGRGTVIHETSTSRLPRVARNAGQGLTEYALILTLIAILAITALCFLSGQIDTIGSTIGAGLRSLATSGWGQTIVTLPIGDLPR